MSANKEPKNAMEEKGCEGCLYREDPSGKGWCQFWGKKGPASIDKFPCWRYEISLDFFPLNV
jgi:hypothetical protein